VTRHCHIPRFEDGTEPSAMKFLPPPNHHLLVVTQSNNKIILFNVALGCYADWHKDPLNRVPRVFRERSRRANGKFCGMATDPAKPGSVMLYSSAFFTTLNFEAPIPDRQSQSLLTSSSHDLSQPPAKKVKGKDAKASGSTVGMHSQVAPLENNNLKIWDRFQPILFMDYVKSGEVVVVEAPWVKIMKRFPDMPARRRYGT
jgi:hypothetical protein